MRASPPMPSARWPLTSIARFSFSAVEVMTTLAKAPVSRRMPTLFPLIMPSTSGRFACRRTGHSAMRTSLHRGASAKAGAPAKSAADTQRVQNPALRIRERSMKTILFRTLACLLAAGSAPNAVAQVASTAAGLERGRYMVLTGHCNNCHTAAYVPAAGKIPEEKWLMGNPIGWRSKQGTAYGTNLRLFVKDLSEDDWIRIVREGRPRAPMPWWSLRETGDDDLRAMFRYIRSLQPLGEPAPAFLPADQVPPRPYQQLPAISC